MEKKDYLVTIAMELDGHAGSGALFLKDVTDQELENQIYILLHEMEVDSFEKPLKRDKENNIRVWIRDDLGEIAIQSIVVDTEFTYIESRTG